MDDNIDGSKLSPGPEEGDANENSAASEVNANDKSSGRASANDTPSLGRPAPRDGVRSHLNDEMISDPSSDPGRAPRNGNSRAQRSGPANQSGERTSPGGPSGLNSASTRGQSSSDTPSFRSASVSPENRGSAPGSPSSDRTGSAGPSKSPGPKTDKGDIDSDHPFYKMSKGGKKESGHLQKSSDGNDAISGVPGLSASDIEGFERSSPRNTSGGAPTPGTGQNDTSNAPESLGKDFANHVKGGGSPGDAKSMKDMGASAKNQGDSDPSSPIAPSGAAGMGAALGQGGAGAGGGNGGPPFTPKSSGSLGGGESDRNAHLPGSRFDSSSSRKNKDDAKEAGTKSQDSSTPYGTGGAVQSTGKKVAIGIAAFIFLMITVTTGAMTSSMVPAVNSSSSVQNNMCVPGAQESTGGSVGNVGDIEGSDNEEIVFNYFLSSGWTPYQSAAWVGNFAVESPGWKPVQGEGGYEFSTGIGWGLAQWTGPRHAAIRDMVISKLGPEYYTNDERDLNETQHKELLKAQLEYVSYELNGTEKSAYNAIKETSNLDEATRAVMLKYENPGIAHYDRRINAAKSALEKYESGFWSGTPKDSSSVVSIPQSQGEMAWPVADFDITSTWRIRVHPITGVRKPHRGTDYVSNNSDQSIQAPADGVVKHVRYGVKAAGNQVVIKHDVDGQVVSTVYSHMEEDGIFVEEGEKVQRGQHIADIGNAGGSTGAHLHFEVWIGEQYSGKNINSHEWLESNGATAIASTGVSGSTDDNGMSDSDYAISCGTGEVEGDEGADPDDLVIGGSSDGPSGSIILDAARSQIGWPYVWGGGNEKGPNLGARLPNDREDGKGYDCSGLTTYAYSKVGVKLPRTSGQQKNFGNTISKEEAEPGDIVWWPGHVGIYAGGDKVVHASRSNNKVVESNLWGSPVFIKVDQQGE